MPAAAQRARPLPVRTELGADLVGFPGDSARLLAAVTLARRVGTRTRLAALVGTAVAGESGGIRAEAMAHFLLDPSAIRGVGVYGGAGVAVERSRWTRESLQAVVGLEARPGASGGWVVEAGVGGGVRLAVGWRWRW